MTRPSPAIVWFRDDLRIADNPALCFAAESGRPIVPLFVHDEQSAGLRAPGAAQSWMLHGALEALAQSLGERGAPLVIRRGAAASSIDAIVQDTGAGAVFWNRRQGGGEIAIDATIKADLRARGIEARSFQANWLHEPSRLLTRGGGPYRVFTPFWRALQQNLEPRPPLPAPKQLRGIGALEGTRLRDLGLLPAGPDWAGGLRETWTPAETGAQRALATFLDDGLHGYGEGRDFPAGSNVSRLSPYLRFGMISPFQVWHALETSDANATDIGKFRAELAWREFCHHLLLHFPDLARENFNSGFDAFAWTKESPHLAAWKQGRTGYPLIDAGMRELWQTGTMHNRVRMVTASFLVKHLLVDWRVGEAWFWDTLVDGDPASNPANWQWVAGCGADAAPYFRIFNPVLQGRKFDPDGGYVRRYVPEIAALPDRHVHAPWLAPQTVLDSARIRLGETYPFPVVDHSAARKAALDAFAAIRNPV